MGDPLADPEYADGDPVNTTNPAMLTQKQRSHLLKFELNKDEHESIFGYRNYQNHLAGRKITNDNFQINYKFNPENELVNLSFLAAYNLGKQKFQDNTSVFSSAAADEATTQNKALTLDINNEFNYTIAKGDIATELGINFLNNKYQKKTKIDTTQQINSTPFAPNGKQILTTFYLNNSLKYGDFATQLNTNLLKYKLSGHRGECETCIPSRPVNIIKQGTLPNGEAKISYKFHDLFVPFVSYSVTHRVPNVQEMFFSNDGGNGVNPHLKPEKAKTLQIGFNAYKHGLFNDNDVLGFKLSHYNTKVKNYIYNENFNVDVNGFAHDFIFHLNNPDVTKFRGWELELKYDVGFLYLNASYARQTTTQPTSYTHTAANGTTFGASAISELPKEYANINLGTRLFSETLDIGTIIKYTGKAKMMNPIDEEGYGRGSPVYDNNGNTISKGKRHTTDVPKIPTIIDLYATYKTPIKGLSVKLEVQNLFDKNYYDALSKYNDMQTSSYYSAAADDYTILYNNSARGRTYYVNFEYRY